jgi:hypothetical protein
MVRFFSVVHEIISRVQKRFMLVWQYQQLLRGILANGHWPRVSYLSASDKGDNEMTTGAVHRSLEIYFTAEENFS